MLYDVTDVALDIYTFYQLDQGGLIDSLIYRDTNVVNAIMVFAVFGALKCIGVSTVSYTHLTLPTIYSV